MRHSDTMDNPKTNQAVITVGDGRGFIVGRDENRFIITAGHCLPFFPPSMSFSTSENTTYRALIGPLKKKPSISAECYFVDPVSDIAVLREPDGQSLFEEYNEYSDFIDEIAPFSVSDAPLRGSASLLSLKGQWFNCRIDRLGDGPLWITKAEMQIAAGMSGSPILSASGSAIGVLCAGSHTGNSKLCREGGPQAVLSRNLPVWLWRSLASRRNKVQRA